MTDRAADRGQGRLADWKVKAALLVAGFEGLLLLFGRLSRWVVIAVAVPLVLAYLLRRRDMSPGPGLGRDLLWVAAASQALVVVAAILAFFIGVLFLVLLAVFAAVALALIYADRPGQSTGG